MNKILELKELAGKATPGPWEAHIFGDGKYFPVVKRLGSVYSKILQDHGSVIGSTDYKDNKENAEFIAACSPEIIRAMCDVVLAVEDGLASGELISLEGCLHKEMKKLQALVGGVHGKGER